MKVKHAALHVRTPVSLGARQLECLELIAAGETSASIARTLGLSRRTVNHYILLLCAKLQVRIRAQAERHFSAYSVRVKALESGSRWTDNTRLADTYRKGRMLLAGDAAHIHTIPKAVA